MVLAALRTLSAPCRYGLPVYTQITALGRTQGLTPRSKGAPTACHQGPAAGTRYIVCVRALASCRRRPLSSNVRRRTKRISVLVASKPSVAVLALGRGSGTAIECSVLRKTATLQMTRQLCSVWLAAAKLDGSSRSTTAGAKRVARGGLRAQRNDCQPCRRLAPCGIFEHGQRPQVHTVVAPSNRSRGGSNAVTVSNLGSSRPAASSNIGRERFLSSKVATANRLHQQTNDA